MVLYMLNISFPAGFAKGLTPISAGAPQESNRVPASCCPLIGRAQDPAPGAGIRVDFPMTICYIV